MQLLSDTSVPEAQKLRLLRERVTQLNQSASADDRLEAVAVNGELGHVFDALFVASTPRRLLTDPDAEVRREALYSCIGWWQRALPALPQIADLRKDLDPKVRRAARFVSVKLRGLEHPAK